MIPGAAAPGLEEPKVTLTRGRLGKKYIGESILSRKRMYGVGWMGAGKVWSQRPLAKPEA
jgi:hypothetical protein